MMLIEMNNKNNGWTKFSAELPTIEPGHQVDIFFCDERWATYVVGMYTCFPGEDLRYCLSEYRRDIDKFCEWNSMLPTHWMKGPEMPIRD